MARYPRRPAAARWLARAAAATLASALAGGLAPAAWAAVQLSPSGAEQGGAAEVTFSVPEDRGRAYTTQVEVLMPAEAPIGEVYPLSADDWAPKIEYRQLPAPIPGIHGSTASVTRSVTWTRVTGRPAATATVSRLQLALGSLPAVGRLGFTVVQTYSDHTVRRWLPGAGGAAGAGLVLTLAAASGAPPAEHGMAHQAAGNGPAGPAVNPERPGSGGDAGLLSPAGHALIIGVLGAGLIGAGLFAAGVLGRRRTAGAGHG